MNVDYSNIVVKPGVVAYKDPEKKIKMKHEEVFHKWDDRISYNIKNIHEYVEQNKIPAVFVYQNLFGEVVGIGNHESNFLKTSDLGFLESMGAVGLKDFYATIQKINKGNGYALRMGATGSPENRKTSVRNVSVIPIKAASKYLPKEYSRSSYIG